MPGVHKRMVVKELKDRVCNIKSFWVEDTHYRLHERCDELEWYNENVGLEDKRGGEIRAREALKEFERRMEEAEDLTDLAPDVTLADLVTWVLRPWELGLDYL